jgi:hypothetical protein
MDRTTCPKCGSNQILNDECLKCGIIISKFLKPAPVSNAPLSFVAPAASQLPAGVALPEDNQYKKALEQNKRTTRIFIGTMVVALVIVSLIIFYYFRKTTSTYGGLYRNDKVLFVLRLPEKGWSHYFSNELDSLLLTGSQDAFYRGEQRNNPDIFVAVWLKITPTAVPENISHEKRQELMDEAVNEITAQMEQAHLEFNIANSQFEGSGAIMEAEVVQGNQQMKALIRTAYRLNRAYTMIILGRQEAMATYRDEVERIFNSLSFKMSVI